MVRRSCRSICILFVNDICVCMHHVSCIINHCLSQANQLHWRCDCAHTSSPADSDWGCIWSAGRSYRMCWPEAPPSSRVHPWKPEPWPPRERLHRPIASLLVSIRARPDSRSPSKGGYVSEFTAPYGTQPTLVDLIPRVPTRAVLLRHLCW